MTALRGPGSATLRSHRAAAGLSQEQLAERSRISERTIRSLESGNAKRPHRETLRAIAMALDLSADASDRFVATWDTRPLRLADMFHGVAPADAFREELERQRFRTRDQFVHDVVEVRADRRWSRNTFERLFEVVDDGVETFHWMQGFTPGVDNATLMPSQCVNVDVVDSVVLPDTRAKVFEGTFGRPLRVGELYPMGYTFDFDAVRSPDDDSEPDTTALFSMLTPCRVAIFEVRFAPGVLPARVWWVRQGTVDGPPEIGEELSISPFGVVSVCEMPAKVGVQGIRWEWE